MREVQTEYEVSEHSAEEPRSTPSSTRQASNERGRIMGKYHQGPPNCGGEIVSFPGRLSANVRSKAKNTPCGGWDGTSVFITGFCLYRGCREAQPAHVCAFAYGLLKGKHRRLYSLSDQVWIVTSLNFECAVVLPEVDGD